MTTKTDPRMLTVYAEATPNPSTIKFVANQLLVQKDSVYEFTAEDEITNSLLAKKLFDFPFVNSVFISNNFISVSKNDTVEWVEVMPAVREFMLAWLKEGKEVIANGEKQIDPRKEKITSFKKEEKPEKLDQKIMEVLNEYIKPAVEQDGGLITFKSFKNGVVKVLLQGACSGCPSSTHTLKSGIESLLKNMIPEVERVEAING